jgi:hypothetical protein
MVIVQGTRRRNLATTTFSTSSVVAFILVVFLGLFLSLTESSPAGARSPDGGAVKQIPRTSGGNDISAALYGTYFNPMAKKMSRFVVHRRGVPLIIHKRIPYIVHRKRMDVGGDGFDGDTFSSGFGDFTTTRRKKMMGSDFGEGDTFSQGFGDFSTAKRMDTSFHGDTFSGGFGDFSTV